MSGDIDAIVAEVFTDVSSALRERTITPAARKSLYHYVRYWADLGATPEYITHRAAVIIRRSLARLKLAPNAEHGLEGLVQQMVAMCEEYQGGMPRTQS